MVALALVLVMLSAAAVYALSAYIGWDGDMMPPDDLTVVVQRAGGHVYKYEVRNRTHDRETVNRNGDGWVTIAKKGGFYEISDPRGTGRTVIRLPATPR